MNFDKLEANLEFGGYFELEITKQNPNYYTKLQKFQSARMAFYAFLKHFRPKKVWIPSYICSAFIEPLRILQIDHDFYKINIDYSPHSIPYLESKDIFVYVNYFGICDNIVKKITSSIKAENLVLDYSQAFFSKARVNSLATIYSPRKFFGIPDGGLIDYKEDISSKYRNDSTSINRLSHLIKRLNDETSSGYSAYKHSEDSLRLTNKTNFEDIKISKISEKIIHSIDITSAEKIRNKNFKHVHKKLKNINQFNFNDHMINAPLCYPFFTRNQRLRTTLIERNIFIPTYWKDSLQRMEPNEYTYFTDQLVALPIDQRYGMHDMEYIADQVIINN